ncbi:MAG: NFACT RNA binding domain-containing protein [Acidobacteriota bacterium]|nr:NFACT RNA binding domain-containing protein [Acidobacteriota bacterium]
MDNFCLQALVQELGELLPQKRIRKVRQLDDRQFLFSLHRPCPFDLVVVLDQRLPCLYLRPKESPAGSPAAGSDWLLSIRSHLAGGTIVAIEKEPEDRAVTLAVEQARWPDPPRTVRLRLELIPLRVNAFLRDDQGRVLRAFRPRQPAAGPLSGSGSGLKSLDRHAFHELVLEACRGSAGKSPGTVRDRRPRKGVPGLSPLFLREIVHRCPPPDLERAWECMQEMIRRVRHGPFSPRIYPAAKDSQPWICTPLPLTHLEGRPHREFPDMNSAVAETCRLFRDRQSWLQSRQVRLSRFRQRGRKLARLLRDLETDLEKNRQAQSFKKYSDLLLAQASALPAGRTSLRLPDLFQPDQPEVTIPLEPRLTALQNATRYARQFRKSSRAIPRIRTRLEAVRQELVALEKQQEQLDRTTSPAELETPPTRPDPIRSPTPHGARPRLSSREEGRPDLSKLARRFVSSEGLTILVGKGNRQNDALTGKVAHGHDFWLHVAGYSGSHVVLRNPDRRSEPSEPSLLEAAQLAAYFSQARNAPRVEVHYTQKKFVSKPKGGKPGLVRLRRHQSIAVRPCIPDLPETKEKRVIHEDTPRTTKGHEA